jgi:hypothetical protein
VAVRRFDGIDDEIRFDAGDCDTVNSAITLVALVRPSDADSSEETVFRMRQNNSTGGSRYGLEIVDWGNWRQLILTGPGYLDSPGGAWWTQNAWALLAVTKAAGTATPRFHSYRWDTSTWAHQNAGSSTGDTGSVGQVSIGAGSFTGDVAAAAAWDSVLSDAMLEDLAEVEALEEWLDFGPNGLWLLGQGSTATPVEDLTGGGADQYSITGTSVVQADPPIPYEAEGGSELEEQVDDSVSVSDSVTIQWSARRSVGDGVVAADQASRHWAAERTVADDTTATDDTATTWAANRSVDDQAETSDDVTPSARYVRSVDDTLTGTDDLASAWATSRTVDDSLEAGDQVDRTLDLKRQVDDAATATDQAARQASFVRDLSDDLEATDDVQTAEAGKVREQVDDTVEATDEAKTAWTAHLAIDDSLEAADQVSAREAGHDTLNLGDSLEATDDLSAAISIRIDDSATLADDVQTDSAAQIRLTIDDGITVTDSWARTWVASRHAFEVMQALDDLVVGFGSQPATVDLRELATTSVALRAAATTGVRLRERATTSIQLTEEPR